MTKLPRISGSELRRLRLFTPYNQLEFAKKLGLSRETVNGLENEKDTTINSLQVAVLIQWRDFCATYTDNKSMNEFKSHVRDVMGL